MNGLPSTWEFLKGFGLPIIALIVFFVTMRNKLTEIGQKLIESDVRVEDNFTTVNTGLDQLKSTVHRVTLDLAAHDERSKDLRSRVIRLEDHLIDQK